MIAGTGGHAWLVSDEEVDQALDILEHEGIWVGRESAASFAAAQRAQSLGRIKAPCVILTGSRVSDTEIGRVRHLHREIHDYLPLKHWADRFFASLRLPVADFRQRS